MRNKRVASTECNKQLGPGPPATSIQTVNKIIMDQRSNSRMETLVEEDEDEVGQSPENFDEKGVKIPGLDKYNLRTKSIQNRLETEKRKRSPKKEPKPKQRPPPLSKYRRRTANARERTRMQVSTLFRIVFNVQN